MQHDGHRRGTVRRHLAPREARWVLADAAAWAGAVLVAAALRLDFDLSSLRPLGLLAMLPIAAACHLLVAVPLGLYAGRWRRGSYDEVAALVGSAAASTVLLVLVDLVTGDPRFVPLGAAVGGGVGALVLMAGGRYYARSRRERSHRPTRDDVRPMLIFGAGEAGAQIVTSMLRDPESRYVPAGLLDDDAAKRNLRISGVPVVGGREAIAEAASARGAQYLLVALPSGQREVIADVADRARAAGLTVKVLPSNSELLDADVGVADIRDIAPSDLIGRHQIETSVEQIAGYLARKRVLVTGAGGSIGSELCRQIARFEPSELVMLDRDESALHGVQLSIEGRALLDRGDTVLCDLRDTSTLRAVFRERRPEVVFHAAALKHLPLLEQYPAEGVRTNTFATLDLLVISLECAVERFVNISTDKAANPISVLGYTKRLAERLTAWAATQGTGTYLSVRFGNVLGTRGSVLETFQRQIESGGPVTVTDPDVTRYFMTVQEAVELVIQAGAIGRPGEVLVLDMGDPVRILDVARRLSADATQPIEIVFTGLRPGEKLHEELFGAGEVDDRPVHPLVSHVSAPPLAPSELARLEDVDDLDALVAAIRALALDIGCPARVDESA